MLPCPKLSTSKAETWWRCFNGLAASTATIRSAHLLPTRYLPSLAQRGGGGVETQNTKGWVVEVVGFADTTGNTAANRSLSERRANAVIGYLVTRHSLP